MTSPFGIYTALDVLLVQAFGMDNTTRYGRRFCVLIFWCFYIFFFLFFFHIVVNVLIDRKKIRKTLAT